ncbi:MAG: zf-TFIIB domain-containing protein [Kiritimatiellaeota bacterium]|nr:zf-TFIIB domain-containing protein [Kiritimatiellota bacterium]
MRCPACDQAMVILEYQGIELDHCVACGGGWLDAGELGLLLNGTPEAPGDLALTDAAHGRRRCPRCPQRMHTGRLPGSGVEVDVCPARHGLWLDRGELVALTRERAAGAEGMAALSQHLDELFGAEKTNPKETKT